MNRLFPVRDSLHIHYFREYKADDPNGITGHCFVGTVYMFAQSSLVVQSFNLLDTVGSLEPRSAVFTVCCDARLELRLVKVIVVYGADAHN